MRNAIRTFAFTLLFYCYLARLRFCLWTLTGFIPNLIGCFSYAPLQDPPTSGSERRREPGA